MRINKTKIIALGFKLLLLVILATPVLALPAVARAECSSGQCCCDNWSPCGSEARNAGNGCAYRCEGGSWGSPIWCDGQGNGQPQFNTEGKTKEQIDAAVNQSLQEAAQQLSGQSATETQKHAQNNAAQRAAEAVRQLAIVETMRQLGQITAEEAAGAGQRVVDAASALQTPEVKAQIAQAKTLVGSGNPQAAVIAAVGYDYTADPNDPNYGKGSDFGKALASGDLSGILPVNYTSATSGLVVGGGAFEVRDIPTPYGAEQPGGDPCAGLGNWETAAASYCGGAGGLYSCQRIKIGSECNQKCGTLVNASCATQMGRPELAGKQYGYLNVNLQKSLEDCRQGGASGLEVAECEQGLQALNDYCDTSAKGAVCNSTFTLQFTCKTTSGESGAICIDRDEFRNSEFGNNSRHSITIYDASSTMTGVSGFGAAAVSGLSAAVLPKANFYDERGNNVFVSTAGVTNNTTGISTTEGRWYVNGGAGGLYTGGETRGQTVAGGAGTPCNPGTFQTMVSNGQLLTTQRGGDRSACGAASGCPDNSQRLCDANGHLSSGCVKSDACAPPASEGESCAGKSRFSNGEPSNGIFVGCSNGQNCFCQTLTSSSMVHCIGDAGIDSCGAAGKPITPTVVAPVVTTTAAVSSTQETITRTTTTTTTEEPSDTPTAGCNQACGANANGATCVGGNLSCINGVCRSTQCPVDQQNSQCVCEEPPAPMCIDIFASDAEPELGDSINFTCAAVTNAVRYEFRTAFTRSSTNDNLVWTNLAPASSTSNQSQDLAITQVGRYVVQCRPCAANDLCQVWESTADPIGGPELSPVTTESESTETATNSAETTE